RTFAGQSPSTRRRLGAAALSAMQRVLLESAYGLARTATGSWSPPALGEPGARDAELATAETVEGTWTVSGADAWAWYAASGVLRSLEIPGRFGSRALLRVDEADATTVQL